MSEPHTISGDTHFGEIVIKEGYASPVQVQECLRIKSDLAEKGSPRQLGAIMVERGYLTVQQVEEISDKQTKRVLECPSCSGRFTVRGYESDKQYSCPRCGNMLSAPQDESEAEIIPIPEANAPRLDPENLVNQTVGGCKVLEKLAIGGMGTIYKARQLSMNRIVVVKTLSEDLAKDKAYVQRFLQEARAAGELSHTNLIHVMDVGYQDGVFYYIMEFIDGINLDTILAQKGRIPVDQAIDVIIQTARALEQAHARNIIHRDIKPDNIMITRDGVVKLADLGIAKKISGDMGVTEPGMVLGTPFYMAPEQGRDSRSVDHRSDIYGLGATFYHMLSGNVPFDGKTTLEIVMKSIEEDPPPLKEVDPSLPDEIVAIIDKMMKKRPEDRYQSMSEVIGDLVKVRDHQPLDWLPKKRAQVITPPPTKAVAPPKPSSGGTKKHVITPPSQPAVKHPPAQRTPQTPVPASKPAGAPPKLSAAKRKELGLDDSEPEDESSEVRKQAPQKPVIPSRPLPQRAAPQPGTGKVAGILADSQGATPGKIYKERKKDWIWPAVTVVGVVILVTIAFKWLKSAGKQEGENPSGNPVIAHGGSNSSDPHPEGTDNAYARKDLEKADQFVKDFPADLDQQIELYRQITVGYPGTAQAAEAQRKMDERVKARNDAIQKDYDAVQAQIDAAEQKGAYGPALLALEDFGGRRLPTEWKVKIGAAQEALEKSADKRYEAIENEANDLLAQGQLFKAIDKLGEAHHLGIERLTAKADSRLSELEKNAYDQLDAAEVKYHDLRETMNVPNKIKPISELLWKMKIDEVKKRLENIVADDGVKAVREEIQGDIADLDLVQKFLQSAKNGVEKSVGETVDLHRRSGEYRKSNPIKNAKITGIKESSVAYEQMGHAVEVDLLALTDDDIVAFALKSLPEKQADTNRSAGIYLLVMGEVDEAEKYLLEASEMGADVGSYLTKIEDERVRPRIPKESIVLFYSTQHWEPDGGQWKEDGGNKFLDGGEIKGNYCWKPVDPSRPECHAEEYILKARAKKVKGPNGFVLGFHAFGRNMRWTLGAEMNKQCRVDGVPGTQRDEGVEEGRWYSLRLVVTKDFVVAYVNNKRQWRIAPADVAKAEQGMPSPGIGVGVVSTRAFFRDIILWPLGPAQK